MNMDFERNQKKVIKLTYHVSKDISVMIKEDLLSKL